MTYPDLRITTTSAFLHILGILGWYKQEVKKRHNLDLRADPKCNLNSRKMASSPGEFLDLRLLRQ